jgi:hypothetical protein
VNDEGTIDAGYFPRIVEATPKGLGVPAGVIDICSVSTCISEGPDDWVGQWHHNSFGWFNTREAAWSAVPDAERARYRMFAYRIAPQFYRIGGAVDDVVVPADVAPEPISSEFQLIGYDAVSKFMDSVLGLECSPLSCNSMAAEIPANQHCLLETLEAAHEAARRFATEQPEPGAYYVVEVLSSRESA